MPHPQAARGEKVACIIIQFSYEKDKNEDDPRASIEMVPAVGYGHLDFFLAVTLPQKTLLPDEEESDVDEDIDEDDEDLEPRTHVLAHITKARGVEQDATTELTTYHEYGRSFILDIKNVEHVAGRVFTRGMRPASEWVIIDRKGVVHAEFGVDEHGSEEED